MSWTDSQVRELYGEYEAGASLDALGRREGVSHETIRVLFKRLGLPVRSLAEVAAQNRRNREREAERRRDEIIAVYIAHGTIDAVVEATGLPRKVLTPIINSIPNREAYRRRGRALTYPREVLVEALRAAHAHLKLGPDEPLTIPGYRAAARELSLPSYDTHVRHFADAENPWSAALTAAGLPANRSRGRRSGGRDARVVASVRRYIEANGGDRGSYRDYCKWANANGEVKGPTVRQLGWGLAVELALDGGG